MPGLESVHGGRLLDGGSGRRTTLANGWNGIGWSLESTPNPVGALSSILQGVSCASSTECVAVGKAKTGTFTTQTLIEER